MGIREVSGCWRKLSGIILCLLSIGLTIPKVNAESATITLGTIDTNQYGRNYGRDQSTSQLDVQFSVVAGLNHEFSWQAYDIETDEMEVFVNDKKIKTISPTESEQLGALDSTIVTSEDLIIGTNTLSFRVTGGDETWGITNLLAESIPVIPGEPGTVVLLDSPEVRQFSRLVKSYSYDFSFTPRGTYYDEALTMSFDTRLRFGTDNGFKIYLNNQRILTIPIYRGDAKWESRSITFDKSNFRTGNNTLRIDTISPFSVPNFETSIRNVKTVSNSTPLVDVTVSNLVVTKERPFNAIATIINLGAKNSSESTVSFYTSNDSNKTNPILLVQLPLASLTSGSSSKAIHPITNGRFIWVCVDVESGDIDASNNCSDTVAVDRGVIIDPIIMLLLN